MTKTKLKGAWTGWAIDDKTLISPSGRKYTPDDIESFTQADVAKTLGVTRGAIADRIRRGTMPPYDDPTKKTWRFETIKHLLDS